MTDEMSDDGGYERANAFEVALLEFGMSCRLTAKFLSDIAMILGERAHSAKASRETDLGQVFCNVSLPIFPLLSSRR